MVQKQKERLGALLRLSMKTKRAMQNFGPYYTGMVYGSDRETGSRGPVWEQSDKRQHNPQLASGQDQSLRRDPP